VTPFAIAALQLEISSEGDNLPHLRTALDRLMSTYPWVEMVVFSELCACGPSRGRAEPLPGTTEGVFQQMAAQHKIWLLPGSLFELDGNRVYNTASVIEPHGRVIGRYRKLFPFYPYEDGVEAGSEFMVFDVPNVGRFGVSICYDLWFPETARTLTAMGAEVILHPVMTTTIDRDVELAIARATAAQQQCYVFDVNGVGGGGNGRSLIVGPAGEVLHQAGGNEELIPIEIDLDHVRRSRERGLFTLGQPLKSFRDRQVKFEVYRGPTTYLDGLGPLEKPRRPNRG